jgi:hypothetical protein
MATYIELRREAFDRNVKKLATSRSIATFAGVRRPLRGIESKNDTYALLRVIRDDGSEIPLYDSSGTPNFLKRNASFKHRAYSNFLIQNLQDARVEKSQLVQTFGEHWIFFFGQRPRSISFQGLLLNTTDFNWKAEWWENYENYLRGTALVENNARLYLFYDNVILEGYLLQSQTVDTEQMPNAVAFNATMILTNHIRVKMVGIGAYPITGAIPQDSKARITSLGRATQSEIGGSTSTDRVLPVRSSISDNTDEFIGGTTNWNSNELIEDADSWQVVDDADLEPQVASLLTAIGFETDDIGKALSTGNGFTKVAIPSQG